MIAVEDLSIEYQLEDRSHRAVDDVSIRVEPGEFFTLLGPSGCGKTSILRAAAGLEKPVAGRIRIADRVVFDGAAQIDVPAHRRDISMVFQSYAIWPHLSVAGNVAFPLEVEGGDATSRRRRVDEALALVGLSAIAGRPATQLSGGQQQRVAIARGIVRRSPVMLLDEPLSNLDAKLREQMRGELRELLKGIGVTVLYVTHDQEEALALSDRIAVMNAGRIIETGAPRELYLSPRSRFAATFLGQAELFELTGRRGEGDTVETEVGPLTVAGRQHMQPERASHAMIRLEAMRLQPGRIEGRNHLHGRLARSTFAGRHAECRVELATGRRLSVLLPPFEVVEEGSEVTVELPAERLRLIGNDGG